MSNSILFRFAGFFTIVSLLVCGATYKIIVKRLKLKKHGKIFLASTLSFIAFIMTAGPLQYRFFQPAPNEPFTFTIQFLQYFLMGWVGVTLILLLVAETTQTLIDLFKKPFHPEKRIFLTEGVTKGILATATFGTFAGFIETKLGPKVEPVSIHLKHLPKSFDQLTLAQISDIHIGPLLHHDYLNHVVDQILSLNTDIIMITGDLVDGSVAQLKEHIEPLRRLKAREGVYFCTGNHEYYSNALEWIAYLESMGIHVFKNDHKIFTRFNEQGLAEHLLLAGVYDWQAARHLESHTTNPYQAAKTDLPVKCKILMAHNPFSIEDATAAGFHLQVSGHTHAGQFYPFTLIAKVLIKYFEGHYHINENTQLYVNRGTGYWGPPNRLGKMSEITHYTLRSG